jgi:hypothetical protein
VHETSRCLLAIFGERVTCARGLQCCPSAPRATTRSGRCGE